MRALHVPFGYYPSPHGGTEVYVAALGAKLQGHGVTSVIAAPGECNETYEWAGMTVHRFGTSPETELASLYGEGDVIAAAEFGRILDRVRPDLVHFHALTAGASVLAMREVKSRRIPLIFTYHTPTVSCVRGTMMKWGRIPCDGLMDARRCSACALHANGLPKIVSLAVAALPARPLAWFGRMLGAGRLATAAQMPALVNKRHAATRSAFEISDHVVAVCDWVHEVLRTNGVPAIKVILCRQGLPDAVPVLNSGKVSARPRLGNYSLENPLRLVFLGRLDQTKGIHVVVEALRMQAGLPVTLDVFGIAQGSGGERYREQLLGLAAGDRRIKFHNAVESSAVVARMRQYDLVVIPSQLLETGPLVVLEAFAAGTPVIGSRLGGISELVRDGVDGVLVAATDVAAWANAIGVLAASPDRLHTLRAGVQPPRQMTLVAQEMMAVYQHAQ